MSLSSAARRFSWDFWNPSSLSASSCARFSVPVISCFRFCCSCASCKRMVLHSQSFPEISCAAASSRSRPEKFSIRLCSPCRWSCSFCASCCALACLFFISWRPSISCSSACLFPSRLAFLLFSLSSWFSRRCFSSPADASSCRICTSICSACSSSFLLFSSAALRLCSASNTCLSDASPAFSFCSCSNSPRWSCSSFICMASPSHAPACSCALQSRSFACSKSGPCSSRIFWHRASSSCCCFIFKIWPSSWSSFCICPSTASICRSSCLTASSSSRHICASSSIPSPILPSNFPLRSSRIFSARGVSSPQ